ncbi:hypothetical protein MIMGU_mgv1a020559mg [Erythranthe guttata]|uniref:Dirigent protein n=1 Tax=Erythranthe guttata TaxID=4155 RepID=A0A022R7W2_ERYGU|nr:hypothetical protein MIMGU_mgv1a020559mg [Erythranthe guttata]
MESSRCSSTRRWRRTSSNLMLVIIVSLLVICSQFCPADCRALRPEPEATSTTTAARMDGGGSDTSMTTAFLVSSNNSSISGSRLSVRGLAFILASGPSKRGPGH